MKKMKVMTVVGTRPEIIRLARVMVALDKYCDIKYDDYGWGILVTEIDGVEGDWIYEVNGEQPGHGADRHYLRDGDTVEWILV